MAGVKVAFLYSEVAGYFMSCAAELAKDAEVLIFRWPVNAEAPFDLEKFGHLNVCDRSEFSQEELEQKLHEFNPDVLVCSGWMDKGYVKAARSFKKKIPVVLALDNHWNGSLKQRLAAILSPFILKNKFTHAWVPGKPQAEFASKLGFKGNRLKTNYYCADSALFDQVFQETFPSKKSSYPKRFLYVARYVEHKGIFEMWKAFVQLQEEEPNDWELWCIGTGDEWENRIEHDKIKHFGFVQPTQLKEYIQQTGVYILPSKFEPWGVSVQEFAISGFPLLISKEVGAKWTYLKDNGFDFESGSVDEIKKVMKRIMQLSEKELIELGEKSHKLGMSFTNKMWANIVISIAEEWKN
ncbi:MAG: glycosyltransferase family 4 protein [Crocinitomicaceae bacterium]|nr:glycosyltransferase family 4 protein [Crocinitomicaceae bacterium]